MRKKLYFILSLLLCVVSLTPNSVHAEENWHKSTLAIMTDVHVQYGANDGKDEHIKIDPETGKTSYLNNYDGTMGLLFRDKLQEATANGAEAILVSGDLTRQGLREEYDYYFEMVNQGTNLEVIASAGNHEFAKGNWNKADGLPTNKTVPGMVESTNVWMEKMERPIYYDKYVGDVHVVCLGRDSNEPSVSRYHTGMAISQEQLAWLEGILDADLATNTTTVILAHHPIANTWPADTHKEFYGYYNEGVDEKIYELIDTHKNAVLFSGHTNASVKNEGRLRYYQTENGGMFVHAGAFDHRYPVYVTMEETSEHVYKMSYIQNGKSIGDFEFRHDVEEVTEEIPAETPVEEPVTKEEPQETPVVEPAQEEQLENTEDGELINAPELGDVDGEDILPEEDAAEYTEEQAYRHFNIELVDIPNDLAEVVVDVNGEKYTLTANEKEVVAKVLAEEEAKVKVVKSGKYTYNKMLSKDSMSVRLVLQTDEPDKTLEEPKKTEEVKAQPTPTPEAKAEFKVRFTDDTGKITYKTETVAAGKSATPVSDPYKDENHVFSGWDKDFTNVTEDLEVRAVFKEKVHTPNTSDKTNINVWLFLYYSTALMLPALVKYRLDHS